MGLKVSLPTLSTSLAAPGAAPAALRTSATPAAAAGGLRLAAACLAARRRRRPLGGLPPARAPPAALSVRIFAGSGPNRSSLSVCRQAGSWRLRPTYARGPPPPLGGLSARAHPSLLIQPTCALLRGALLATGGL